VKAAPSVDAYLAEVPEPARVALERIRSTVRALVPEAGEKISYGVPTFTFHGNLVHYGAAKNHLSFYPGSRRVMQQFAAELTGFETTKGATIRFTPARPIPLTLLKRIVKARVAENLARR